MATPLTYVNVLYKYMFCVLRYLESPLLEEEEEEDDYFECKSARSAEFYNKTLLINPNCYIQILIDYIFGVVNFNKNENYVMCDEMGTIIEYKKMQPSLNASTVLESLNVYYIVRYEVDDDGNYQSLEPVLNQKSKEYMELMIRLRLRLLVSRISLGRKYSKTPSESRKRKKSNGSKSSNTFGQALPKTKSKQSTNIGNLKSRDLLKV